MEVEVPIALTSYFASSSGRTCKGSVGTVPREFADPKCPGITNGSGGMRWRCPPAGLVKINFDGAVFGASNMFGIGVVIWDSNGAVLASCSQKIPQSYKVEEIEALAALKALSFAFELGFRSAILEGDSLGLIQALK